MTRQQEHQMLEKVRSLILSCSRRGQNKVVLKVSDAAGKFISSYFSAHGYSVELKNNQATITIPDKYFKKVKRVPVSKVSKMIIVAIVLTILMIPAYFIISSLW